MIHCIGNSHVQVFSGADPMVYWPDTAQNLVPGFRTYNIGPIIAYNFTTKHLPKVRQVIEKEKIGKIGSTDSIMLVVGEVDCRWHLPYQASLQKRDALDVVQETVGRYFESFLLLRETGYNVIAWALTPPHRDFIIMILTIQFSAQWDYVIQFADIGIRRCKHTVENTIFHLSLFTNRW